MKIAISADHHLTTQETHPDRFTAMEDILHRCADIGVDLLIIAGDLFDHANPHYADFEDLFREHCPPDLLIYILPGNHDLGMTGDAFTLEEVIVYTKPGLVSPLEEGPQILLLPYQPDTTMGEEIAPFAGDLRAHHWLLVSHGDWTRGEKYPDPYEPGLYMPLTQTDLDVYKPRKVFLGHIHRPTDQAPVHYPGSPCPLNVSETGLRRFLTYDTGSGEVTSHVVNSPLLYFQESFLVFPAEDEIAHLSEQISDRVQSWDLPEGWEDKVQIRVTVTGFTRNRAAIKETIIKGFDPYSFYDDRALDLSDLKHSTDPDRAHIAQQVKTWVDDLDWAEGPRQPEKGQILAEALKAIYGA